MKVGDNVQVGDVLGKIGLSGRTQFPHVHVSVRHNGTCIDPFAPSGTIHAIAREKAFAPYLALWGIPRHGHNDT